MSLALTLTLPTSARGAMVLERQSSPEVHEKRSLNRALNILGSAERFRRASVIITAGRPPAPKTGDAGRSRGDAGCASHSFV